MNAPELSTPHDATPETALAAIREFDGPLLLDLDETLYLGNSTEDFIDSARPGVVAVVMLKLLDWISPWRWTGGEPTRDTWRVRLVMALLPWTAAVWRRRVPELVERFGNGPLVGALRARATRPIILTRGFHPIVGPLVAAFNLGEAGIVAARPEQFDDRLHGKLPLAIAALGEDTVRRGLVITDSADDLALLEACARPLRTVWPQAHFRRALASVYLPGRYLTSVKRRGERYVVRGILQEDFAFWLLASIALAAQPVAHVAGLLFLLLSFWTIYECGYVDNDRIAARHETDPQLNAAFHDAPVPTPRGEPWAWALLSGALAILLLRGPGATAADLAIWSGVLLATHGWFLMYNRLDKMTRVWLYPGLQLARAAAFVALVPVAPVGAAALGAHVLARWLPYYVYRTSSGAWPRAPQVALARLVFFAVLALLLAFTAGAASVLNLTAAALLGWNLLRARRELASAATQARRIDHPRPGQPA